MNLVKNIFVEDEANLILSIPVGNMSLEDKLLWHYSKNDEYSVKSGYKIASHMSNGETSHTRNSKKWRKYIWSLKISPKIKHFLFKHSHSWLLTNNIRLVRVLTLTRDVSDVLLMWNKL